MDVRSAASFFDRQPVYDAYSGGLLFNGQPELYDGTVKDAAAGWRQSISAALVVAPPRRVVSINSAQFLLGRVVSDYFDGVTARQHAILHPCDGLFVRGTAAQFLLVSGTTEFYAAEAIRKEQKEESESSQFFNMVAIYASTTEHVHRDHLIRDFDGVYYRVQNIEHTTGEFKTLVCSELGDDALCSVTYVVAGAYNVATDTTGASTPVSTNAIVERWQSNYRYRTKAAVKCEPGDKIVTLRASAIAAPVPGDHFTINGIPYQVLAVQSDGNSCWELHSRVI